jgi:hypothetical protein
LDKVSLEFRQCTKDMEDQLTATGGCINRFLQAFESYTSLFQHSNRFDEVFQRTTESIQSPDDQRVPFPDIVQGLLQTRSLFSGAAGLVAIDPFATGLLERICLQRVILLVSGDTGFILPILL